jgi:hypothetical protein
MAAKHVCLEAETAYLVVALHVIVDHITQLLDVGSKGLQ